MWCGFSKKFIAANVQRESNKGQTLGSMIFFVHFSTVVALSKLWVDTDQEGFFFKSVLVKRNNVVQHEICIFHFPIIYQVCKKADYRKFKINL